jgi:arylsulfatase A
VLTYALEGEYQSFKCLVGFDESGRGRGQVICRVMGDGKELYADADLKATTEPKPIDIDVAGVKRLSLEIDFGAAEDTGDRVIWAEPRVFRADKK